jgi:hypothetical protein
MRKIALSIALCLSLSFAGAKEDLKQYLDALGSSNEAKALQLTHSKKQYVTKAIWNATKKNPEKRSQFKTAPILNCTENAGKATCTVQLKKVTTFELTQEGSKFLVSGMK